MNISYPLIRTCTCTYQGARNLRFSENSTCFVFLKHPFWDSPFCLITDLVAFVFLWNGAISACCNLYRNSTLSIQELNFSALNSAIESFVQYSPFIQMLKSGEIYSKMLRCEHSKIYKYVWPFLNIWIKGLIILVGISSCWWDF